MLDTDEEVLQPLSTPFPVPSHLHLLEWILWILPFYNKLVVW